MKKNFFSIIIPTTTISDLLINETFPALDVQSFKQFEVIVVPDTSSKKEIQALSKKYTWLTILPSYDEHKPGIKRDMGAKNAKGSILVFIDDDVFVPPDWLKHADSLFQKYPKEVAMGGPGIIVKVHNFWENVSNTVLQTRLGSGELVYRFRKDMMRHVDDYPTMNLFIKKDTFQRIGGFQTNYWPGEDSKLVKELMNGKKKPVLYHPDIWVHHHRRSSLLKHIMQHANYGKMRGTFAAQGDKNSTHLIFAIPTIFTLYCLSLGVLPMLSIPQAFMGMYFAPFMLYAIFALWQSIQYFVISGNIVITLCMWFMYPLTHFTYGISYLYGYIGEKVFKTTHE